MYEIHIDTENDSLFQGTKKAANIWKKKSATKVNNLTQRDIEDMFKLEQEDYPREIVPFADHPDFLSAPEELKQDVLSWGAIAYNNGAVSAEEKVSNPAFLMILRDVFPGTSHEAIKLSAAQAIVDESYHILLHTYGTNIIYRKRNLKPLTIPDYLPSRILNQLKENVSLTWEKNLLTLVFAVVSEASVNAYLNLIANNTTIQPLFQKIAKLHSDDEYRHAKVCSEIIKSIYLHFNQDQKNLFIKTYKIGLEKILAHDFDTWESILVQLGFKKAKEIINDCRNMPEKSHLVRDYTFHKKFAEEMGIFELLDFDFSKTKIVN